MNEDFAKLMNDLDNAFAENDRELDALADSCDPKMKLAVTRWAMKHIVEQAKEGGSYRYLIYDRLGFGPEAYVPLCEHGLVISNEFDLNLKDNIVEAYKSQSEIRLKKTLGLCDEPNCYNAVSSGWPTPDGGYRLTCSEHYEGKLKNV
jgi:hypothetical protein